MKFQKHNPEGEEATSSTFWYSCLLPHPDSPLQPLALSAEWTLFSLIDNHWKVKCPEYGLGLAQSRALAESWKKTVHPSQAAHACHPNTWLRQKNHGFKTSLDFKYRPCWAAEVTRLTIKLQTLSQKQQEQHNDPKTYLARHQRCLQTCSS